MKILIVGNGVAGTFTAQNIRNLDKKVEIEIYSQEKYPYYTRVKLPELISERVSIDDLIVFKDDWYKSKNIKTYISKRVEKIHANKKQIILEGESEPFSYDKLILALGSMPNIPPIANVNEFLGKGIFTIRNIDDVLEVKHFIKDKKVKNAIIIGGGLLGLELARQIKNRNLNTTVVEFFPRLLPRQLDVDCGEMLKEEIERMGISVVLDAATEEILGVDFVKGIRIKDGPELEADIVLIQAGVRPTISLAKEAKLETNKGIIVNEFLETSEQDVYAVGDCIEYKNQTWGIIPACMEQSKILAASILGKKKVEYIGTIPKSTLKILGISLTSIGIFDPSEEEGGGWEILKKSDKKDCCYQKIVLKDNKLKGAILFGENKALSFINKNIGAEVEKDELRKILELYLWICSNCDTNYDDAVMNPVFEYLPEDWKCPNCKGPKDGFKKKD